MPDTTKLMTAAHAAVHALRFIMNGGRISPFDAGRMADALQDAANEVDTSAFTAAMMAAMEHRYARR